jgi:hypothetical protein
MIMDGCDHLRLDGVTLPIFVTNIERNPVLDDQTDKLTPAQSMGLVTNRTSTSNGRAKWKSS